MRIARNIIGLLFVALLLGAAEQPSSATVNCTITSGWGTSNIQGTCENGCGDANLFCLQYCTHDYAPEDICTLANYDCVDNPEMGTVNFSCNCICLYGD